MIDKVHKLVEIFKSLNLLNPEFMWDVFKVKDSPYNLRSGTSLKLPCCNCNALLFRSSLLWCRLENRIKTSPLISSFKGKLKLWLKLYMSNLQTIRTDFYFIYFIHLLIYFLFFFIYEKKNQL